MQMIEALDTQVCFYLIVEVVFPYFAIILPLKIQRIELAIVPKERSKNQRLVFSNA